MLSLLKMDVLRLVKSRSFYIILGVTAALIVSLVLMVAGISDPEVIDALAAQGAEIDLEDQQTLKYIKSMDQLAFVHETLGSGFLLVMIGIGVTLFVNSDFSSGFVKNICYAQPRRTGYVLSKTLTAGVYSGVITTLSIVLTLLSPYLYGMHPLPNPVPDILQYMFWMWLPHWAFAMMALALVLLVRNATASIILSLVAGGGLTAVVLGTLSNLMHWPPVERYLLASVVKGLYVPKSGIEQLGVILVCTVAWIAVYGIGGLLSIEKRDI